MDQQSTKNQSKVVQNRSWRVSWGLLGPLGTMMAPRGQKRPQKQFVGPPCPPKMGPCWGHFGLMLGPCWGHVGSKSDQNATPHAQQILIELEVGFDRILIDFGKILGGFWVPTWPPRGSKNHSKRRLKCNRFFDQFLIDLGSILEPTWPPSWKAEGPKIIENP